MLLIFYIPKKKNYISEHNSNREKQVILLMISNVEGCEAKSKGRWHYLAEKKLSPSLKVITCKHPSDFYCLNCLHSFATENKRESHN